MRNRFCSGPWTGMRPVDARPCLPAGTNVRRTRLCLRQGPLPASGAHHAFTSQVTHCFQHSLKAQAPHGRGGQGAFPSGLSGFRSSVCLCVTKGIGAALTALISPQAGPPHHWEPRNWSACTTRTCVRLCRRPPWFALWVWHYCSPQTQGGSASGLALDSPGAGRSEGRAGRQVPKAAWRRSLVLVGASCGMVPGRFRPSEMLPSCETCFRGERLPAARQRAMVFSKCWGLLERRAPGGRASLCWFGDERPMDAHLAARTHTHRAACGLGPPAGRPPPGILSGRQSGFGAGGFLQRCIRQWLFDSCQGTPRKTLSGGRASLCWFVDARPVDARLCVRIAAGLGALGEGEGADGGVAVDAL